jgi:glucose-6-phosphate dehydrogenase assembly protein OpcA
VTTLWDTTGSAVVKELAAQRRTGGAVLSGVALTLVVVADESRVAEAEEAATTAAEQHPCRLLIVVRRQIEAPVPRLDAEVLIGGRLGPGEAVVMRMYGRLALHAESVVLPLLAADAPVVAWWHAAPPQRMQTDALAVIADRRITDSSIAREQLVELRTRAEDYAPGDTDLAWTRSTSWRATLTSTVDSVSGRRGDSVRILGGEIGGDPGNATAQLLAGWLSSRCGCPIEVVDGPRTPGPTGVDSVSLRLDQDEEIRVQADRRGGAVISQPFRPDSTVALADRALGDLLGEELRRLDPDEPYQEALETATGVTGLADRSPVREHVWFDPAEADGHGSGNGHPARTAAGTAPTDSDTAAHLAPTVPADSENADEVAEHGEHDSDDRAGA